MTVSELIKVLNKYPKDMKVIMLKDKGEYSDDRIVDTTYKPVSSTRGISGWLRQKVYILKTDSEIKEKEINFELWKYEKELGGDCSRNLLNKKSSELRKAAEKRTIKHNCVLLR